MQRFSTSAVAVTAVTLAASLGLGAARAEAVKPSGGQMLAVKSPHPVKDTLDRLQKYVTEHGFFVVARVPHSEAAKGAGLELRPTELMIFGEPKSGTPIMQCNQRAGIDLPLKALAWQDADGQVWVGMTDPQALKQRYELGADCDKPIAALGTTVQDILGSVGK